MKLEQLIEENYGALMTVKQPILFEKNKKGWKIKLKPTNEEIKATSGVYFKDGIPSQINKVPAIVNHILIRKCYRKLTLQQIQIEKIAEPTKKV